jgi:Rod binding domain-containing protein
MVASLRQTSSFGDGEGMFGSGPGAATYTDWFDQNLAEQVMKSSDIGIRSSLLRDFERSGAVSPQATDAAVEAARTAAAAADRRRLPPTTAAGGIDALL